MIRDQRMLQLVAPSKEPIQPFIHKVRHLYNTLGVSTVLVIGGCGEYFSVADTVVMMDGYRPVDVTARAREIAGRDVEASTVVLPPCPPPSVYDSSAVLTTRVIKAVFGSSADARAGKIYVRCKGLIQFGSAHQHPPYSAVSGISASGNEHRSTSLVGPNGADKSGSDGEVLELDLTAIEQLVDTSQTRLLAACMGYFERQLRTNVSQTLSGILLQMEGDIDRNGLDAISGPGHRSTEGNWAACRSYEIAAALNRLRSAIFISVASLRCK